MTQDDEKELLDRFTQYDADFPGMMPGEEDDRDEDGSGSSEAEQLMRGKLKQWTSADSIRFFPSGETRDVLISGVFEIILTETGPMFERIPIKTENLIRFPQTNIENIVEEIKKFWTRKKLFKRYGFPHKRGIFMWGPAGAGKSCTIQLVMKDVIEDQKGIGLKFSNPTAFKVGLRVFRQIQPETPVVVLMEDMDAIIRSWDESEVLNLLDGIEATNNIVFLATSNYPEVLGPRIINRPSRFDKRFKIDYPNPESRKIYLKHIMDEDTIRENKIDLETWVKDTDGFSFAHLKELFIAVVILGDEYEVAIEVLTAMKEEPLEDEHQAERRVRGLSQAILVGTQPRRRRSH